MIKPLLVIRSPRHTEEVEKLYDKIDFVDKLWIKYYPVLEMQARVRKFVRDHPEYTHIILTTDDVYPTVENMIMLLEDLIDYDYPAISGCCNMCEIFNREHLDTNNVICSYCEEGKEHPYVSVTINPIEYKYKDNVGKRIPLSSDNIPCPYDFITTEYQKSNQKIVQCFFQGFAFGAIRRDIFLKIGCRPYLYPSITSDDLGFAVDCYENQIPQYVDLRIFMRHDARSRKNILVGKEKPYLAFEKSARSIFDALYGDLKVPILICSPFNNEDKSIPQYFESLINLNYPKELIDLIWFENDSVDNTSNLLEEYSKKIQTMGYHSFKLIHKDFGLKKLGKVTPEDFGQGKFNYIQWGKNYFKNNDEKYGRAMRLSAIYDYFFGQLDPKYHKFIVILMADVIAPSDCLLRYLKVFQKYPDAGWVGGVHHKRYPLQDSLAAPLMFENNKYRYPTDSEIMDLQSNGHIVFECGMTGHVWMMKENIITGGARTGMSGIEIVEPLIRAMREKGFKVYCDSGVYLKHISLDGKIYREGLQRKPTIYNKEDVIKKVPFKSKYNPDRHNPRPHP